MTLFKVLRGCNISIQFDTLPNTIKLLGNELGHVIKQQAGIKYYKIVEEIRVNAVDKSKPTVGSMLSNHQEGLSP